MELCTSSLLGLRLTSADRHAVNGDLLAWGDYNEQMTATEQEISDELGEIFG